MSQSFSTVPGDFYCAAVWEQFEMANGFPLIETQSSLSRCCGRNRVLGRLPRREIRRNENRCDDSSRNVEADFQVHVQMVVQFCIALVCPLVRRPFLFSVQKGCNVCACTGARIAARLVYQPAVFRLTPQGLAAIFGTP